MTFSNANHINTYQTMNSNSDSMNLTVSCYMEVEDMEKLEEATSIITAIDDDDDKILNHDDRHSDEDTNDHHRRIIAATTASYNSSWNYVRDEII